MCVCVCVSTYHIYVYVYTLEGIEGGRVGARQGVAFIETLDPSSGVACQRTTKSSVVGRVCGRKATREDRVERAAKKEESEET